MGVEGADGVIGSFGPHSLWGRQYGLVTGERRIFVWERWARALRKGRKERI
jgi:hypothetical protein